MISLLYTNHIWGFFWHTCSLTSPLSMLLSLLLLCSLLYKQNARHLTWTLRFVEQLSNTLCVWSRRWRMFVYFELILIFLSQSEMTHYFSERDLFIVVNKHCLSAKFKSWVFCQTICIVMGLYDNNVDVWSNICLL